jgi:hypothetical protein
MELRASSAALQHEWDFSSRTLSEDHGMAYPGKREGLAQKVDTAAQEAERLGLTTATLILRMARLEIDRAEPEEVESMPRSNLRSKPN